MLLDEVSKSMVYDIDGNRSTPNFETTCTSFVIPINFTTAGDPPFVQSIALMEWNMVVWLGFWISDVTRS